MSKTLSVQEYDSKSLKKNTYKYFTGVRDFPCFANKNFVGDHVTFNQIIEK
jgi:hypothetical protein